MLNTNSDAQGEFQNPSVSYDGWLPTDANYYLTQDSVNALECNDTTGTNVFRLSTSDFHIATPLHAAGAITQHQDRFHFPCPVVSTFYVALNGIRYKANDAAQGTELHVGENGYGAPLVRRLRPGNVIEIDMTGLCRSNGTGDEILYIEVYLGDVRVGHSSSTNKLSKSGTTDRPFNLHLTMTTPSSQFVQFSTIPVRMRGLFSYHNYHTTNTHIISGFGIDDEGASVPVDEPGELRIVASWLGGTSSACWIEMMSTKYSCTGFNT
jgi:hypothetical protein